MGDKLTAFAPTTTGILFGKNKETELVKQLFDLGELFNDFDNLQIVKDTFLQLV